MTGTSWAIPPSTTMGLLLDLAIGSTLLLSITLAACQLLARRRPLIGSAIGQAGLLGLLLLPISIFFGPRFSIPLLESSTPLPSTNRRFAPSPNLEVEFPPAREGAAIDSPQVASEGLPRVATRPATMMIGGVQPSPKTSRPTMDLVWILIGLYASVALVLLARLAGSMAAVGRLRRSSFAVDDPAWIDALGRLRDRLGIARTVRLARSSRLSVPVVVGWLRPTILLPASPRVDTLEHAESILLHELAHVRRGDYAWNVLLRLVQTAYWPQPLVWLLGRAIVESRERACDAFCVHQLGGPAAYHRALLAMAEGVARRSGPALGLTMASASRLARRLVEIDRGRSEARCVPRRRVWAAVAVLLIATAAAIGQARITRAEPRVVEAPTAGRSKAIVVAGEPSVPVQAASAVAIQSPLPPRALLRIGTDDLRIRGSLITGIAFSPDGRLIATAEANSPAPRVSLFDARTGRLVKIVSPPERPPGWVQCVAFSPDQTKLAWGEIGGQVALWDLAHDRLLFREKLHGNGVNEVVFSPDGQVIASGGEDGAVRLRRASDPRGSLLDLATGERQPARRAYSSVPADPLPVGPLRLAFTPDGASLIVGSGSSGTITVWRIKDGQLVRRIENAHGSPKGVNARLSFVAVTPDGRRILSSGQSTVPITQTKLTYGPKNVSLTEIRLWDLETGERIADLHGGEDFGRGHAALSRDGRQIAVGDFGVLRILDLATRRTERTISLPGCWGDQPAFSPDGTLVAKPIHNAVGVFEVATGRRLFHQEGMPEGFLEAAAWSPTGDRMVTGHHDGEVRVWDAATGKLLWHKVLAHPIGVHGRNAGPVFVAFSGDGRSIVVAGRRDDPIRYSGGIVAVYDATDGTLLRVADHKTIRWGTLAPDGRTVVVGTSYGSWNDTHLLGVEVGNGQTRWTDPPEDQRAGFVQLAGMLFRPGSSSLEVAIRDGNVVRLDALTGREQRRFLADGRTSGQLKAGRPKEPGMFTAAFSTDGRTMASSSDESVCVWDVEAGSMRRRIQHPNAHGCFLALTPDGKTVATSGVNYAGDAGQDEIFLYSTDTGDLVLSLEPNDDRSHVMVFSPDGNKLLSGFNRGTAIVWDVGRPRAKE